MNTRKLTLSLMSVLVLAMVLGFALSSVMAKPPTAATYKCIDNYYYFCTLVGTNPTTECCQLISTTCPLCQSWYWYTDGLGNTYTCTEENGGGTCILHACP